MIVWSATHPARREQKRGFVLLVVLIAMIVLMTLVTVTMRSATEGLATAGSARSQEMVSAAAENGLERALDKLQRMDPAEFSASGTNWDIFDNGTPLIDEFNYPASGPYANAMGVVVGLRLGQATQPPAGEDVRNAQGAIVEVQIRVRMLDSVHPAEESVVIGVQIPNVVSHSNS